MPLGYNIVCDPGDLYSRKWYTVNPNTGAKEEILGYTSTGDPVSKGASTSSWLAFVPSLTSLNLQGQAYKPYGEAGMPYTKSGLATGAFMPASGTDSQDLYYLNEVMPGSQSRKMYNKRVCNPLWNTFGCKTGKVTINSETENEEVGTESKPYLKEFGTVLAAGLLAGYALSKVVKR